MMRFVILACLLFFAAKPLCERATDGFTVAATASALCTRSEWVAAPLQSAVRDEAAQAMTQKFAYLGSGGQSFVFLSEDGNYVLKLFKNHYGRCPAWVWQMPLPALLDKWRNHNLKRREAKLQRDYHSYCLAYEVLRDESGLLVLHLNPTAQEFRCVRVTDKLNIEHILDLDGRGFLLQRKADMLYEHLALLMRQGDIAAAQQAIRAVVSTIVTRCKKGVYDEDPKLHRNIGFSGEKAVFIDVGRFKRDPERATPEVYGHDLLCMTRRFERWLSQNYPVLVQTLTDELCAKYLQ